MNYIFKLAKTGALRKTPTKIINKIVNEIDPIRGVSILELGGGKGEITEKIIKKVAEADSTITIVEKDKNFSAFLSSNFNTCKVIESDAFDYNNYLNNNNYDYIISSIPLSFNDNKEIEQLLNALNTSLKPKGKIIILFHAFWLTKIIKKHLHPYKFNQFLTIPPYFLITHTKD